MSKIERQTKMKITDVFMIALAVGAYLKQGTLANIIFACVAVYFIARIVSVVKR
ncbi:MAG: hypothetical protein VZR09_11250 [Candidatus Gastranaerophilaceae bacterium]|nr:hypothetical protein [Candidatus Gastranaerophilaceae bacterium]